MQIKIYTDGGCSGNPGPGAWAFIINAYVNGKQAASSIERSGGDEFTTNNRMELSAAIHALEAVPALVKGRVSSITLITDSRYVQQGMTDWIETWKANGWKSTDGMLVKNAELWLKLDSVAKAYNVDWQWVKGHDGDEYNERCDALVQQVIKKLKAAQKSQGKVAKPPADTKLALKGAAKKPAPKSAAKKPAPKSAAAKTTAVKKPALKGTAKKPAVPVKKPAAAKTTAVKKPAAPAKKPVAKAPAAKKPVGKTTAAKKPAVKSAVKKPGGKK